MAMVVNGIIMGGFLTIYLISYLDSQLQCVNINVCHVQYINNDSILVDCINSFFSIICNLVGLCNNMLDDMLEIDNHFYYCFTAHVDKYTIMNIIGYVLRVYIQIMIDLVRFIIVLIFFSNTWMKRLTGLAFVLAGVILIICGIIERNAKKKEEERKIK